MEYLFRAMQQPTHGLQISRATRGAIVGTAKMKQRMIDFSHVVVQIDSVRKIFLGSVIIGHDLCLKVLS